MAAMHTTIIRASITAYSTAVGPSSARRNRTALASRLCINSLPFSGSGPARGPGQVFLFPKCVSGDGERVGSETGHPLRRPGNLLSVQAHGFASPPRGGFALV